MHSRQAQVPACSLRSERERAPEAVVVVVVGRPEIRGCERSFTEAGLGARTQAPPIPSPAAWRITEEPAPFENPPHPLKALFRGDHSSRGCLQTSSHSSAERGLQLRKQAFALLRISLTALEPRQWSNIRSKACHSAQTPTPQYPPLWWDPSPLLPHPAPVASLSVGSAPPFAEALVGLNGNTQQL